ncbi:MAG: DUF3035 domain-containing protein [Rickettsiaceae bacterium]|nr:DUF3035 domain-containing protein [Rickettsiaceae bacterium]
MKKLLLLSAALLITSACSNKTKKTLGLTESLPDEYQTTRNKNLEIPPCYQATTSVKTKSNSKNQDNLSNSEKALLKDLE